MKLYLCEKPTQGKEVAEFLGMTPVHKKRGFYQKDNVVVTWAVGHLFKLKPPEHYKPELKKWDMAHLPVLPSKYEYSLADKTKSQYRVVKDLLKKTKELFIATDPDPEGECIARNIIKFSQYKGDLYRVLYSATDKRTLEKAFANPLPAEETEWMYQAALARAQSDWVVGMNLTMAMTLVVQKLESSSGRKKAFPVGRVKTPAAMLVLLRELAIRIFEPVKYYELEVEVFTESKDVFTLKWDIPKQYLNDDKLLNQEFAQKAGEYIKNLKVGEIVSLVKEHKKKQPPLPYELTSLQTACDKFELGPDETLEIAQSLYDKPLSSTTYPRTSIPYLPEGKEDDINDTVKNLLALDVFKGVEGKLDLKRRTKAWNDKKVKVHHGIIPTPSKIDVSRLTQKQKAVYVLIAKRYLAQFMEDYVYENTRVTVKFGNLEGKAVCNVPVSLGWKSFESGDSGEEKEASIPSLKQGQKLGVLKVNVVEKSTRKPSRYTKASLAKAMETIASEIDDPSLKSTLNDKDGIGTVATRPSIIADLVKSGLLVEKKRFLEPSRWFEKYSKLIPEQMKQPANTALWERGFEAIKDGKISSTQFVEFQAKFVKNSVQELNKIFTEIK